MDKFFKRKAADALSDDSESSSSSSESEPATKPAGVSMNKPKKKAVARKWNDDYIKYGFYLTEEEKKKPMPRPTCMICTNLSLDNQAMVPNKLNRHLLRNHPGLQVQEEIMLSYIEAKYAKGSQNNG